VAKPFPPKGEVCFVTENISFSENCVVIFLAIFRPTQKKEKKTDRDQNEHASRKKKKQAKAQEEEDEEEEEGKKSSDDFVSFVQMLA
jgi:hypothetical protein